FAVDGEVLAEALVPGALLLVECGEFFWAVAGGDSHEEAATAESVQACCSLGHQEGVLEGNDDRCGPQRDCRGPCCDVAQVHPGVVDLPVVAEGVHAQGDVACPDSRKAAVLGETNQA